MTTGSCLCGAVAWECGAPFLAMWHCHCSLCRKSHGTAFGTFALTSASGFRWLGGADSVRSFSVTGASQRPFCGSCGSVVARVAGEHAYVPMGCHEGDPEVRPSAHLFAGSKAAWHEIADGILQFDAFPPTLDFPILPSRRHTVPAPGVVRGACLCGAIAYECDAPLTGGDITSCHCTRCRRARAAAHASNTFVALASFRWLRGEERLRSYKVPDAQRFTQCFCGDCGAPQPNVQRALERAVIPCGSFEDDPGIREARHIFVSSRAPWFEIADELPQFAESPPPPFPPVARAARA
jgi:hypothetical protein